MSEDPNKNGVKSELQDPITGKFIEGNPGGGRPVGKKNFETEMEEAIVEFAKLNNLTPAQVKLRIYLKGAKSALDGEYNFYRDFMDRKHGKAKDSLDITTGGEKIQSINYFTPDGNPQHTSDPKTASGISSVEEPGS